MRGKAGHRRSHAFVDQGHMEIVQRARTSDGENRHAFQQTPEIGIVVVIQTAHGDALPLSPPNPPTLSL